MGTALHIIKQIDIRQSWRSIIDIGTIVFPQKSRDCVRNQSFTMTSI